MSFLERLTNFEEQPLSQIAFNMCKWFDFDEVIISNKVRDNVESGIWITVKIEYKAKKYQVDGQRIDIVKRRLIEFLTKHLAEVKK